MERLRGGAPWALYMANACNSVIGGLMQCPTGHERMSTKLTGIHPAPSVRYVPDVRSVAGLSSPNRPSLPQPLGTFPRPVLSHLFEQPYGAVQLFLDGGDVLLVQRRTSMWWHWSERSHRSGFACSNLLTANPVQGSTQQIGPCNERYS